jgi:hypothetical protein
MAMCRLFCSAYRHGVSSDIRQNILKCMLVLLDRGGRISKEGDIDVGNLPVDEDLANLPWGFFV